MARYLDGTKYTVDWLLNTLNENDYEFRQKHGKLEILEVSCKPVNEGGGKTSKIFLTDITFEDGSKHGVVFKVPQPVQSEKLDDNFVANKVDLAAITKLLYEREVKFYKHFGDHQGIPMPKIFAIEESGSREGAILMEYLSLDSTHHCFTRPFSVPQIISVTKAVAKLVSTSLLLDFPIEKEFAMPPSIMQLFLEMLQLAVNKLAKMKSGLFGNGIAQMKHLVENIDFCRYIYAEMNQRMGLPAVLVHGDLHTNNMMWQKAADGSCSDQLRAIFDWQLVRAGNIGYDLAVLLVAGTDSKTRKQAEHWIFDYFHALIKCELCSKGMDMPFTVQQIRTSYRHCVPRQTLFLICLLVMLFKENVQQNCADEGETDELWLRLSSAIDDSVEILNRDLPQFFKQ